MSSVDMSGQSDEDRGQFPYKSPGQMAVGDALALISAVAYGVYVTVMKRRVGNEERVNMPLFFAFVGLSSMVLMWPGFIFLHLTGMETFELPTSRKIWTLVLVSMPVAGRHPAARERDLADCLPGQLDHVLHQRHGMGVCHALDHPSDRDGRPVADDPTVADRPDVSVLAVLELGILAWSRRRDPLLPVR